ncbi:MAG: AAA family ATPase [Acidimicrobiaceae bacterium]|nr:AAA family ATPase [Acidimicrobiaceae bacterium]
MQDAGFDRAGEHNGTPASVVMATVDRSALEAATSQRLLVYLDCDLMEKLGARVGDAVEITSWHGRRAIARLGESVEADSDSGILRLDRLVRKTLKAKLDDRVEIRLIQLTPARRVLLRAPTDISRAHGLREHLKEMLVEGRTPCSVGNFVYVTFHDSHVGAVYEICEVDDDPGEFVETTELELESPQLGSAENSAEVSFEDVGGLRDQIALVRELVQLPLQLPFIYRQLGITCPRGVIFYGPPGVGKTYLAKAIANDVNAHFFFINGPAVVGTMQGETESNLRRIFSEAAHHAPSLIFIDEVDAIASRRGESGSLSDVRAVTTLLSCMDGLDAVDGVVVIGTTNRMESIDPAMRRPGRFDREIFIGPPDEAGRYEILQIHTREMPMSRSALENLRHIAAISHGFVGADLMELCREAGLNALRRHGGALGDYRDAFRLEKGIDLIVEAEDFDGAMTKIHPSGLREALVSTPRVSWDEIGGLDDAKRELEELVLRPLHNAAAYRVMGLPPRNGILLHGPSGTGKTMLVHALAHSAKINFLPVDGPEIFSKWLGESEEAIRHIFQVARQVAPAIIFLDQLDAIAPPRGSDEGSKTTERVVNQILGELDAVRDIAEIVVIGATNRLDLIDSAILRPGRLGAKVEVGLPCGSDRAAIAGIHLRSVALDPLLNLEDAMELVSRLTDGMSGADVAELMVVAKTSAFAESDFTKPVPIRHDHLLEAARKFGRGN